jgi:hypothetical protein
MKTIEVTIDTEGAVLVEAHGFRGKGCKAASEAIEKALGVAGKSKFKPEYGLPEKEVQRAKH